MLILREVLGFSAREVAESLETTAASVNSALQRARAAVDERLPEQSQQATLRALGDQRLTEIVDGYVDAWERGDIDAVVAMLAEDATFAMPPLGPGSAAATRSQLFLAGWPMSGDWRWRAVRARANGQAALAFYSWDADERAYRRFALNVLTFRGQQISDVTAFLTRSTEDPDRRVLARLPEQPADPGQRPPRSSASVCPSCWTDPGRRPGSTAPNRVVATGDR